jgi:hypothetical protein
VDTEELGLSSSHGRGHWFETSIAHGSLPKSQHLRMSDGVSRVRSLKSVRRFFQTPTVLWPSEEQGHRAGSAHAMSLRRTPRRAM